MSTLQRALREGDYVRYVYNNNQVNLNWQGVEAVVATEPSVGRVLLRLQTLPKSRNQTYHIGMQVTARPAQLEIIDPVVTDDELAEVYKSLGVQPEPEPCAHERTTTEQNGMWNYDSCLDCGHNGPRYPIDFEE